MATRFSKRSQQEEIMDDLDCSGEIVNQTLRELDTINALLGGNYVTLQGVGQLLSDRNTEKVTLLDLGCGSGKMLRLLGQKFNKYNLSMIGVDANSNIIEFAADHNVSSAISFEQVNILSEKFKERKFDIAVATLFFHHFTGDQLVQIIRSLQEQCRVGIVINDLHRHWIAYYSIKILTLLFSRSDMVKFDAPISVLRGFRKAELRQILNDAGVTDYTLRWKWAFRWQIVIRNSAG